jgi:hypothetical protein
MKKEINGMEQIDTPEQDVSVPQEILSDFVRRTHVNNAFAVVQPIGLYCMDTGGATAINGATFAVKLLDAAVY